MVRFIGNSGLYSAEQWIKLQRTMDLARGRGGNFLGFTHVFFHSHLLHAFFLHPYLCLFSCSVSIFTTSSCNFRSSKGGVGETASENTQIQTHSSSPLMCWWAGKSLRTRVDFPWKTSKRGEQCLRLYVFRFWFARVVEMSFNRVSGPGVF